MFTGGDSVHTSRKKIYIILAIIVLLQGLICVRYCVLKKGFFVDELWGAGLANSYFRPRLFTPDVFNTNAYLTGNFFRDYLTVAPDEGFSIASVWYNQSKDSHPPLYFLLYHVLSCFQRGGFSKWTGFAINLFFLVCSDVYIFLTTRKLTGCSAAGLAVAALWGFSTEAVSYTLCARMYMMAAFFVILFVYKSLMFYEPQEKSSRKDCLCLLLATTGGCLTHYYFYIAAFVMAALTCIYLSIEQSFRKARVYGFSVLGGVFLSWLIYPQIFESLIHGDGRGREAVRNMIDIKSLWFRIGQLVEQIEEKLLYKPVLIMAVSASSLIIITIVFSILWQKRIDPVLKTRISMFLNTELSLSLYLLAVAKLQPYYTNRYYFPITPLLWVVVIGNVILLVHLLLTQRSATVAAEKTIVLSVTLALTIAAGAGVIKGHFDHKVMFLFPRQGKIMEQIQQLEEPSALFIEHGITYTLTAHCHELAQCSEIMCIDLDTEDDLFKYDIHDEGDFLVVFSSERCDQQKLLDYLLEHTSYSSYELIGRGSGVWWEDAEENYIYCFSKT